MYYDMNANRIIKNMQVHLSMHRDPLSILKGVGGWEKPPDGRSMPIVFEFCDACMADA